MNIGIIGYGSFGRFATEWLREKINIKVYDPNLDVPEKYKASIEEVCKCDYLIIAIPLKAYDELLKSISDKIGKSTVVVDVCSVKQKPIDKIKKFLPQQPFIATHPLFGPESASKSVKGHTVVICDSNVNTQNVVILFQSYGLNLVNMSAEEHDKEMAYLQGLTFYIAKGLDNMGVHKLKLKTPSFQKLVDLADLDKSHSDELLDTIFNGNDYFEDVKKEFLDSLD